MLVPQWIIEKKRDGEALSGEEINDVIAGFSAGTIPDYQMAALAMAIFFRGMTPAETAALTDAMLRSGDVLDLSSLGKPTADKHSTGGVGDKISLVLAPLVACCDIAVPMMSGRGLGITGGTLDKLASIPGYRTDLGITQFMDVLRRVGCSIIGQTDRLAPADRKLYALRDVTGTVPSIPLICASIMSKKLAEGARSLVLDVKWGSGAFMKTEADALRLARGMIDIGTRLGRRMSALVTDMNQPLGRCAGTALEMQECIDVMKGSGPADVRDLTIELGAEMLVLAGRATGLAEARVELERKLASGAALDCFRRMVEAQGGNGRVIDRPDLLPLPRDGHRLPAPRNGRVRRVDAERIGRACLVLGAGRTRTDESIDPAAGISGIVKIGEQATAGQPLMILHGSSPARVRQAVEILAGAVELTDSPVDAPALITHRIQPGETPA